MLFFSWGFQFGLGLCAALLVVDLFDKSAKWLAKRYKGGKGGKQ